MSEVRHLLIIKSNKIEYMQLAHHYLVSCQSTSGIDMHEKKHIHNIDKLPIKNNAHHTKTTPSTRSVISHDQNVHRNLGSTKANNQKQK